MKKVICSVLDSVANVYALPFTSFNAGTAVRDFGHAVRDPDSQLHKSPGGFSLYAIGSFDDDTGEVVGNTPQLLAKATQFISEE